MAWGNVCDASRRAESDDSECRMRPCRKAHPSPAFGTYPGQSACRPTGVRGLAASLLESPAHPSRGEGKAKLSVRRLAASLLGIPAYPSRRGGKLWRDVTPRPGTGKGGRYIHREAGKSRLSRFRQKQGFRPLRGRCAAL